MSVIDYLAKYPDSKAFLAAMQKADDVDVRATAWFVMELVTAKWKHRVRLPSITVTDNPPSLFMVWSFVDVPLATATINILPNIEVDWFVSVDPDGSGGSEDPIDVLELPVGFAYVVQHHFSLEGK